MRVYSAGNAPWDSDDNMLPVIADDPLLQFGKFSSLVICPPTSTWPHLNSDVGLDEGEY